MQKLIKVRQFSEKDFARILEIEASAKSELTPLSSIRRYYHIPSEGFIVAELEGKIVGYLIGSVRSIRNGELQGHILSVGVDTSFRKMGIGHKLVDSICGAFRQKGLKSLGLEVKLNNHGAREFYRRLGFIEACILKHHYRMRGFTEDAVFMSKEIEQSAGGF